MRELLGLAATMIEASGATQRRHSAASAMMVMAAGGVVALGVIGVLYCLLSALWFYELPMLGDVGSALVVAAVLAGITAIAGIILHTKTKKATPPPPAPQINIASVVNVAQSVMKSHKFLVLLGALAIGLAAGESENRR